MLRQAIPLKGLKSQTFNLIRSTTIRKQHLNLSKFSTKCKRPMVVPLCPCHMRVFSSKSTTVHTSPDLKNQKIEGIAITTKLESSVHQSPDIKNASNADDVEVMGAMKAELQTIKDTFSLRDVPRDSLYIGIAGILPYAATSLSTIYLAWDINHADLYGSGFLFSPETAHHLLELITPIQIGYGAIIISFLGAVHWGLEYAGFGGRHSYRRLMYGVIAPIIAWPTLLMPVETALISQFLAFNYMYFVDARATVKGWFPPWYSIYRFVLTFFVGATIVVSLIGRGQIVRPEQNHLKSLQEKAKSDREHQLADSQSEENARREIDESSEEI
ncbi:putative mitochondrial inner membrane protein 1 protein [Golovinomyces cichoracearum]|uniref:Putative mitochondrial inner membrane protein 1 protein n=1 Tax=Golovinomyces cichoracearum TaxID=62708 RepID=A0A420ICZ2_9PEZI|nr:putative mitochondrial inner membrane protein 1 protein [Golovinomyces cichoracearum]